MQAVLTTVKDRQQESELRARAARLRSQALAAHSLSEFEVWCAGDEIVDAQRRVGLVELQEPLVAAENGIERIPDRGGRMADVKQDDEDEAMSADGDGAGAGEAKAAGKARPKRKRTNDYAGAD